MKEIAILDTNLLVLLVIGKASEKYIAKHKRTRDFDGDDFKLLGLLIAEFAELILLPRVVAESSSLIRQIANPARLRIQEVFRSLVSSATEVPIPSISGLQREEFFQLGITDAVILHLCSPQINGIEPILITIDRPLRIALTHSATAS